MADVTFDDSLVQDDWAWVPLAFPDARWASAHAWSSAVGDALAGDAFEERERWRASAAAVAALPAPADDVVGRVWHTTPGTGTLVVGHVRLGPDAGDDAGVRALDGLEAGALQRLVEVDHPRLSSAVHSVAIGTTTSGATLGILRWSGIRADLRVTVEAVHPELQRLGVAEPAFAALFDAVGVEP